MIGNLPVASAFFANDAPKKVQSTFDLYAEKAFVDLGNPPRSSPSRRGMRVWAGDLIERVLNSLW
jgi:hypothetical protein